MTSEKLPATLTCAYINAAGYNNKYDVAGNSTTNSTTKMQIIEDPKRFLTANGVVVPGDVSEEAINSAVAILEGSNTDFWSKHASLHPNMSRVKNWRWVHGRFRVQAAKILELQDTPTKQLAAFVKFQKKIKSHSDFEDTQLFKFFVESKIGNQDSIQELMKQHDNNNNDNKNSLVEEIQKGLEKNVNPGTTSQEEKKRTNDKLTTYVKELNDHLELEETTLLGPWLQLSPEQYKTYRTYLSWSYCFVY